jgi:glutamate dehydrogenase
MELAEEEGCSLSDIAMAFVAAEHIFALPDLWAAIDIAPIDERVRLMVFDRVAQAVRSQMADIVRNNAERLQPGAMVAALQKPAAQLSDEVDSLLNNQSLQQYDALETELVSQGVSGEIAARVAHLYKIDGIIGLSRLSNKSGIAPDILARAFTDIGERLSLDWVQLTAAQMSPSDPWERLLVAGMARDFQQMRLDYLADSDDPLSHVDQWAQQNAARITLFRRLVERAQNMVPPSISMLAQIASQARILLARS